MLSENLNDKSFVRTRSYDLQRNLIQSADHDINVNCVEHYFVRCRDPKNAVTSSSKCSQRDSRDQVKCSLALFSYELHKNAFQRAWHTRRIIFVFLLEWIRINLMRYDLQRNLTQSAGHDTNVHHYRTIAQADISYVWHVRGGTHNNDDNV
uniref:Uncharacterized protein n=1 Tax=Glossina pallidipes TaxID=7398 RepID=A0A1A9ZQB6_GLOPL